MNSQNTPWMNKPMDPIAYYLEHEKTKRKTTKYDEDGWTMVPTLIEKFTRHGEHIVDIQAGNMHSVAASDQSRLYSWGEGFKGKLGQGYNERLKMCENQPRPTEIRKKLLGKKGEVEVKVKQVCCGQSTTLMLRLNGQLLVTGKNEHKGVKSDDYMTCSVPGSL